MKQLYVIIRTSGAYEDTWRSSEFVTDDEAKATEFCARMNAEVEVVRNINQAYRDHQNQWVKDNPPPRWFLTEDSKEANPAYHEWIKQRSAVTEQWYQDTYSEEVREQVENDETDNYWDYEPIGWLGDCTP